MRQTSVGIVGAGVTGLSIAFHLAERGVIEVIVWDRVGVGSGASAIQPGGVRQQWGSRENCLLARESYGFYRDVGNRLDLEVPARLDDGGYLFVAFRQSTLERLDRHRALQNEFGIPSASLSRSDVGDLVPGLDPTGLVGAVYCHQDGYFDRPQAVVAGFANSARKRGVLIETEGVATVEPSGGGWVLRADDGSKLLCDRVVVAAGCDAPELLRPLGIELPIRKEARHLFYSDPIRERLLEPLVVSPDQEFAAKQLADGCVLASDLSARGAAAEGRARWHSRIRESIETVLPVLEFVTFPVLVEGFYDMTPDSQPILGEVPGYPGLYLAVGLSGRGFMMAPAIGRIVAEAVSSGVRDELLDVFSLDRFERDALHPEPQVV